MPEEIPRHFMLALEDFRDARRRAALERIMARMSGKPAELLSFEGSATS
jgi:hypothetical protein